MPSSTEIAHDSLTELHVVETMTERKTLMLELADGVITLPGGHGTLDELFEALAWLQLGIHQKPVGLLNVGGFYDHLLAHLKHTEAQGFLTPNHLDLLISNDDPHQLLEELIAFQPRETPPWDWSRKVDR